MSIEKKYALETVKEVVKCLSENVNNGLSDNCKKCSKKELCDSLYDLIICGYRMCSDLMHGAVMHTILEIERTERDLKDQASL
ncbi:MAG: hypothetical protein QXP47_00515 [Candidatus Nezhaarchaeales archaeon]|nr:MAG: hypothetical protein DSO06_06285 [Candidatus Nezhaarchaeota archaeon WYZ-LMO8]TDA35491.1 MAG: hypothetical protein DSO05_05220 [Candidatus Nezhaarchaeota archaeon WYZ-LMO7]